MARVHAHCVARLVGCEVSARVKIDSCTATVSSLSLSLSLPLSLSLSLTRSLILSLSLSLSQHDSDLTLQEGWLCWMVSKGGG